jgi:anaerobic magnesium-protoporphyrin IX monomethyl ester cyclase
MKKVMLINPPNTMPIDSVRRIAEPIGLLYVGASLKKNDYIVDVFDMVCEGYNNCTFNDGFVTYGSSDEDLKKRIEEFHPDIIGITCMFSSREKNVSDVSAVIRKNYPDIPIVVGGIHTMICPSNFLRKGIADYVILGEGEERLPLLLNCLTKNIPIYFDGVVFKRKGKIIVEPLVSRIYNLDIIPFPDRDLIDMEKYIKIGTPFAPFSKEQRVAQILATRGCMNRCNFCTSVHFWGYKVRTRSVENIIEEMKLLKEKYNIQEIQFTDDNLTADKEFAKELFRQMIPLKFSWCTPNGLMFNTLDEEMIDLMYQSGAYQLTLAIESGSKRVLKEIIHKNVRLDKVKDIISEAHKRNITIHGYFIIGFPGETKEEMMETLQFPFDTGFDSVSYYIANPLPGSYLFDECKKKGYLPKDYDLMNLKTSGICIPNTSPDYVMSLQDMIKLLEDKTHEFNEYIKKKNPEIWEQKFKRYLGQHPENQKIIDGRVT